MNSVLKIDFSENMMHLNVNNEYANVSLVALGIAPTVSEIVNFVDNMIHSLPVFRSYYNEIVKAMIVEHSFFIPV